VPLQKAVQDNKPLRETLRGYLLWAKMTYKEYLDFVVQVVAKNAKPEGQPLTAAALGGLLRQASPAVIWKDFNKKTLSELLADLARQGRISLTKTDKDALAIILQDAIPTPTASIEKFNPLRKSIWDAFVLATPAGKRFMHRRDGTVRVGLDVAPTPADDWIEILPIAVSLQRGWAEAFIAEGQDDMPEAAVQMVGGNDWHPQKFAKLLNQIDADLARLWNRFRSAKVSVVVQDWLTQHILSPDLAFQPTVLAPQQIAFVSPQLVKVVSADESDNVRQVILAAISTLPLEKLLEIPIPAGAMLSALSNTKMR